MTTTKSNEYPCNRVKVGDLEATTTWKTVGDSRRLWHYSNTDYGYSRFEKSVSLEKKLQVDVLSQGISLGHVV
jgi:hypothetical protein